MTPSLKVDIVVHGRFHGFALATALIRLGADVKVLTNYPVFAAKRFGLTKNDVRCFVRHGVSSRIVARAEQFISKGLLEPFLHRQFGAWAARNVRADADIVYGFSGVMEETLNLPRRTKVQMRGIVRGSAHIREQTRILMEEATRNNMAIELPSEWMIEREEREYKLADSIFVLSEFARESFFKYGFDPSQIKLNPLGVSLNNFAVADAARQEREKRIKSGAKLRVLTVGTFSLQKGARDMLTIAQALSSCMDFRFVGTLPLETASLVLEARQHIDFVARVPEPSLRKQYAWADLFFFPTIQDGFAVVLAQASASGLPILATRNCGARELVIENKDGWVLPIRDVDGYIERLTWCHTHRLELARMAEEAGRTDHVRTWTVMAEELLKVYRSHVEFRANGI